MANEGQLLRDQLLSKTVHTGRGRDELLQTIKDLQHFLAKEIAMKEGWTSVKTDELKELLVRSGALQDQVDELQARMTAMALERQKVDQMLTAVVSASADEIASRDKEIDRLHKRFGIIDIEERHTKGKKES